MGWWFDSVGNTCEYYEINTQYCDSQYAVDDLFGISAQNACCACIDNQSTRDDEQLICISNRQGLYNETNGQYVRGSTQIGGRSYWKHYSRDLYIVWNSFVGSWRLTEGIDPSQNVRGECVSNLRGCDFRFWEGAWIEDMWTEVEFTKCDDFSIVAATTSLNVVGEYSLVMSSSGCACKDQSFVNGVYSHDGCNVGADGSHEPWCEVTDSNCGSEGRDSCRFCTWFKVSDEQLCETELDGTNYVGVDTLAQCQEVCRRNPDCFLLHLATDFAFLRNCATPSAIIASTRFGDVKKIGLFQRLTHPQKRGTHF